MKLKEVKIKNFRSLKSVIIPLSNSTIIIGENNSGKSAFLDAIRIGLTRLTNRRGLFEEYDYYASNEDNIPQESEGITLEFLFQEEKPKEWPQRLIRELGEVLVQVPWEEDISKSLQTIILRISSKFNSTLSDFEQTIEFLNINNQPLLRASTLPNLSSFQQQKPVFYLSALRNTDESFGSKSVYWSSFLKKVNVPKETQDDIQSQLSAINEQMISIDPNMGKLKETLESLQDILALGTGTTIDIEALPIKIWDLMSKSQIVLSGHGGNMKFPLKRHGQGTQSLAVLFLFQAYIDVLMKPTFSQTTTALLAIEEPEAHLHPHAVRALGKTLSNIDAQKVITSHSPYLVQNSSLLDIRVLRRKGTATEVFYVRDSASVKIDNNEPLTKFIAAKNKRFPGKYTFNESSSTLTVSCPITDQEAKGLIGMFRDTDFHSSVLEWINASKSIIPSDERESLHNYVQRTRGELFFARGWMLGEGQTEAILFPYFAELIGCDLDVNGISFIDYKVNGSPGSFVKLARALGMQWMLICDGDKAGTEHLSEIKNAGFTDEEIEANTNQLPEGMDIEKFLIRNGFLEDYEDILGEKVSTITSDRGTTEYYEAIAVLIQQDKVSNSRKLIDRLRAKAEVTVPDFLKNFIERCVANANEKFSS